MYKTKSIMIKMNLALPHISNLVKTFNILYIKMDIILIFNVIISFEVTVIFLIIIIDVHN